MLSESFHHAESVGGRRSRGLGTEPVLGDTAQRRHEVSGE